MGSIKGVPLGSPFASNVSQPDIGADFARWQGWIDDPNVYAVKFDDLVVERGGPAEEKRLHNVERILDHLGVSLSFEQIKSQFASYTLNPEESHTFKKGGKGSIGGWKDLFNAEHKEAFKQVAGQTIIELGYEQSLDW